MKAGKLEKMIAVSTYWKEGAKWESLQRYAAMQGIDLPDFDCYAQAEMREIEIPIEAVMEILALDFAARATGDLRAMGEGMARVKIEVPSNINVWSHTKGLSAMQSAAENLANAAKLIAEKETL